MINIRPSMKQSVLALCLFASPLCLAAPLTAQAPGEWQWSQQPWSDSDTAYLNAQSQIAGLWQAESMSLEELDKYKQLARAYPNYPIMLFRWGYYAYCFSLLQPENPALGEEIKQVAQALETHLTPNNYLYARLRYLIAHVPGQGGGQSPYLDKLGERLLRRYPGDARVKALQGEAMGK